MSLPHSSPFLSKFTIFFSVKAILKANQSTKIHTAQDIQFRNATSAIAGTSQSTTSNNTQHVVASSSATKKT